MRLRAARLPPKRRRAVAARALLPLPCRDFRLPGKTAPGSRVELLLLNRRLGEPVACVDQLVLLGIPSKSQPDRRPRFAIIQSESSQDMTGTPRPAGAGRAEREGDVPQVSDQTRG